MSYKHLDKPIQDINRIIQKNETVDKHNKASLEQIMDIFIPEMKSVSPLFNKFFRDVFYGGSYWDGLRIADENNELYVEYDIDLLLSFPKIVAPKKSNKPAFMHITVDEILAQSKMDEKAFKEFKSLLCDKNYLSVGAVNRWMQRIVAQARNQIVSKNLDIQFNMSSSGPAQTIRLTKVGSRTVSIDIDLVPCIWFGGEYWSEATKQPQMGKTDFFLVPKRCSDNRTTFNGIVDRYWRMSFQIQERQLINAKYRLKEICKLMKKLRNTCQHKSIKSYYIKTLFLPVVKEQPDKFWNQSAGEVLMFMLKKYLDALNFKKIPYYWDKNYNLIDGIKETELSNISNRIATIIKIIETKSKDNPEMLFKLFLTEKEQSSLSTANGMREITNGMESIVVKESSESYCSIS